MFGDRLFIFLVEIQRGIVRLSLRTSILKNPLAYIHALRVGCALAQGYTYLWLNYSDVTGIVLMIVAV